MNNIRQNVGIKTTIQTSIIITPEMKQSLAMLQMPLHELTTEINSILENNPLLELIDNELQTDTDDQSDSEVDRKEDIADTVTSDEWQEYIGYDIKDDISYTPAKEDEFYDYEQYLSDTPTLYEHLMTQLKSSGIADEIMFIGEFIIGNLSDEGYFTLDKEESAKELNLEVDTDIDLDVDLELFDKVLSVIKSFDPVGVAAETLNESIFIQIALLGEPKVYLDLIKELLNNYSDLLINYRYEDILKKMRIERDTFDYLLLLIKKTDPKPGLNYASSSTDYITPDVYILREKNNFEISINESGLPAFKLNKYYINMFNKSSHDKESKQYVKDKIRNALWVIESLQKRQSAIRRVVTALIDVQREFLMNGIDYIKPLKLKDISEITGLHESTISRVTSGKYAMTEHGLIELKSFFVKSIDNGGEDISTTKIKSVLKDLIDKEDPNKPFSDQRLVEELSVAGLIIARRTVAKYRDELNIKTMSQRKRLKG